MARIWWLLPRSINLNYSSRRPKAIFNRAVQKLSVPTPFAGAPVFLIPETDSTMHDARELVASGCPSGTVVVTDFQSAGRGRLPGRQWVSPPGESLMATVALKSKNVTAAPLRVGVAVAQTLERLFLLQPTIKWPNDVLLSDRKVCGILCEYSDPWLFAGIGLNLLQESFPEHLATTATSVARERVASAGGARPGRINRDDVLAGILERISRDTDAWHTELDLRLWGKGQAVRFREPDGTVTTGTLLGVDEGGLLRIARSGVESTFAAGELISREGRK